MTTATTAPTSPVEGDVWFDTTTNNSKIYDGSTWLIIDDDTVTESATAPTTPVQGDIWFDTNNDITKVWDGSAWLEIKAVSAFSLWDKDEDTGIQVEESADEDKIRFDTAGSERMIIDETGDVGIGTTAPDNQLHIDSNTAQGNLTTTGQMTLNNDQASLILEKRHSSTNQGGGFAGPILDFRMRNAVERWSVAQIIGLGDAGGTGYSGGLSFLTQDGGTTNPTDSRTKGGNMETRMIIQADGDVGIGTTSPSEKLDVNGRARVRTLDAGATADEIVVADNNGVLKKRALTDVVQEPWFGDDDDAGATTNTEDIYHLGHVGIGVDDPGNFRLNVQGGQQRWSSSTANTDHTIDFSTPAGHTGFVFNAPQTGNRSRFDFRNNSNATVGNRSFSLAYNNESALFIRKGGNVGVRTAGPAYNLDVNGSFRNLGHALIDVMNGSDGNMTGVTQRGIHLWNHSDTNWGIYMARAGAGRAMGAGTAVAGHNFDQHAVRFRAGGNSTQGFVFETHTNQLLASIRGSDGYTYFNDQVQVNELTAGAAADEIVVADTDGVLKKRALTDVVQEPWFGTDDNAAATTNTENMYVMGDIGVGTSTLSTGKVATFAGDVDIQGVLDPTKLIFSGDGTVGSFNPTTNNQYEIEFQEGRDLLFRSNNNEVGRFKSVGQRFLFANPGDFATPGTSASAVIGIDGTTHSRLRLTAGTQETYNDSEGASIDLHGNDATANSGVLDLVAGDAASAANPAIKFWTNTDGSTQQTSAVITGAGDVGIGTTTPAKKLHVVGQARITDVPDGTAADIVMMRNTDGDILKLEASALAAANEPWFGDDDDAGATTNTEDIYHMGQVGIGVDDPDNLTHFRSSTVQANFGAGGELKLDDATATLILEQKEATANQNGGRPASLIDFRAYNGDNNRWSVGQIAGVIDAGGSGYSGGLAFLTQGGGSLDPTDSRTKGGNMQTRMLIQADGDVGIRTMTPETFLHVQNTNAIDGTAVNNINPVLTLERNGTSGTKYNQEVNFAIGTYEANIGARTRMDIRMGLGNTSGVDRTPMTIRADGRVGINNNGTPEYNLDINGTFKNDNAGFFTVMGGNDDDVNDTTAGGHPKRGIRMWTEADTNWGIYMSRSGAGRSLSSGTAVSGGTFTSHSIRFRALDNISRGFIFENSNEEMLLSIRASDGLMRNKVLDDQITTGVARRNVVTTPEGDIVADSTRGTHYSPGGWVVTTEQELMPVGRWATIGGRMVGQQCQGLNYTTTFKLEYKAASGFSLIENYGPSSVGWTFSGTGTAADPYKAVSGPLFNCVTAVPRLTITVKSDRIYMQFSSVNAKAYNFVVETIP